jgi:acyl dehydratase
MTAENKVITDKAIEKLRIGEVIETREFKVTDKWVKKYALAIRDPNPLWFDEEYAAREGCYDRRVAPAAFCVALNPMERGCCPASAFWAELRGVPDDGRHWGGFAAYNEFEYEKPIYVGDRITCEVANRGCYEKQGKRGVLVVAETEYRMINQDGETVGVGVYGNMVQFGNGE